MHIFIFFIGLTLFLLFILSLPDLFPLCSCCYKKKLRPFIKIHIIVSIHPGYSGSRSVCRKCSRTYGIESLSDLDRLKKIQKRIKLHSFSEDL